MEIEEITTAPTVEDFTLLSAHQEQTPGTFFGGKPVLHLHCPNAELRTLKSDVLAQDASAIARWMQNGAQEDGGAQDEGDEFNLRKVDVWVTSRYLVLFSTAEQFGAKLDYSMITFHAQEGNAVLLGLSLSDANTPDEDIVFFHARIVPGDVETHTAETQENGAAAVNGNRDHARILFDAISACQELNPDPPQQGDDDDVPFDETAPGATGWITSENMQDFMDENGQFRIPEGVTVFGSEEHGGADGVGEGLGQGAGAQRTAANRDAEDGSEDETKWQRTG